LKSGPWHCASWQAATLVWAIGLTLEAGRCKADLMSEVVRRQVEAISMNLKATALQEAILV
jgi:hypothetical protein